MAKKGLADWESYWRFWEKIGPPWRPHPKLEVEDFWGRRILEIKRRKRSIKALILGSTPEFRDFFARHGMPVTLLDANPTMYKAMGNLMKNYAKNREKFVEGDWFQAERIFGKNKFDLVISSTPHSNFSLAKWPEFFEILQTILKPNGHLMISTIVTSFTERMTVDEAIEVYKKNPKYFRNFKNKLWTMYQMIGEEGAFDEKLMAIKFKDFRSIIKRKALSAGLNMDEIDRNLWFIPGDLGGEMFGNYTEFDPPLEEQLKVKLKYFYLDGMFMINSHPAFKIRRAMILKSKKEE